MNYNNVNNIRYIIDFFTAKGYPVNFICGLLGNIQTETANSFNPNQVQLSYLRNKSYNISSCDDYVRMVNDGSWVDPSGRWFGEDRIGFGLSQLTSNGRKTKYYEFCKGKDKSIDDLKTQCEWIDIEIHSTGYANVRKAITNNYSIEECARVICTDFERPAKKNDADVQQNRINRALDIYNYFFKEKESETMGNIVIAINAGHWNGNPKGVPANMPLIGGTREFTLNNKVVMEVQKQMSEYDGVTLLLNYDTTGKDGNQATNGLVPRIDTAEKAKANMYFSIHHNGGGGRGSVAYCKKNDKTRATKLYNDIISFTNSKGNRVSPINNTSNLTEIIKPSMTSYLIECAFMDNVEDVKLIAQSDWSEKVAKGIVKFIVEEYGLKKRTSAVKPIETKQPTNPSSEPQKPVESVPTISYTIKKGDTLGAIASRFGTTVVEISKVNPEITNLNKIYVGQEIKIPSKKTVTTYIVQSGDTLSKIGKKFNVAWKNIAIENNVTAPFYIIHKGQTLVIPN